jgi:MarR family transcriptional regulator, organic hydroperoxide resistance regulator
MPQRTLSPKAKSEEILRLDNQLCFALYAASRAITSIYRPALDELGLTYPQYLVMLVLWERGETSVSGLGERLSLDSGTLTPLLKRMEKQGFVVRQRSANDERQVNISLTLAGARLKKRAVAVPHTLQCSLQLPAAKVSALRDELNRIVRVATGKEETK